MKIGNIELKGQVILAPMAGVCNSAFRKICKEMGASLVCAEMVSDKGMVYNSKKTKEMLYFEESERPISQQIFGSSKETFVEAAKMIYEIMHPDIIDINMGCPVPKVAVRSQAGSALLKNPDLIYEIVSSVVKAVPVPVTVKIRSGWDNNSINAVEVAKVIEKAGASAITVHPRTRSQLYSGKADLEIIKKVKESVSIPVIGNGDITSIESAKYMLEYTKCDAIMIGRGVLGNPWLIKEIDTYLNENQCIYCICIVYDDNNRVISHNDIKVSEIGIYESPLENGHIAIFQTLMYNTSKIKFNKAILPYSLNHTDIAGGLEAAGCRF